MHALLLTLGSYGDVHPFVGLGARLRERGHRVTLLTNEHFAPLASAQGLEFAAIGSAEQYRQLSQDRDLWHARRGGLRVLSALAGFLRDAYTALDALAGPDAVVAASSLGLAARVLHERRGVPLASVHLAPFVFRSVHDPPRLPGMFPLRWLPRFVQRRFWDGADRYILDPVLAPAVNALRAELGLSTPVSKVMDAWWHAPQRVLGLWPAWFGPMAPDWPAQVRLCGFPLYDERGSSAMPAELERFLESGAPPVAFTPGSAMMFGERFFEAAVNACERLGLRGVLLSRSDHHVPRRLPKNMIYAPYAPFSTLLTRCCALVHHGGIGTLSQGLAAGAPQVVMPMAHDQHDNAARLERLGAGLSLRPRQFTPRRLASRLERLLSGTEAVHFRSRCGALAAACARDDALTTAAEHLEELA